MGALTNLYVAATSGSDGTGTGTSGAPYKTVQALLNGVGRDGTNGNYVNLSGDDIQSASLNYGTWGSPTATAPTIFRNWTGGPDGTGGLDGNAGNFNISNAKDFVSFQGLKLHNTGTAQIVIPGISGHLIDCEIYTNTNSKSITSANYSQVMGNNFYDCGTLEMLGIFALAYGNYLFQTSSGNFGAAMAISCYQNYARAERNIVTVLSNRYGIYGGGGGQVINNSVFCTGGGTLAGIHSDGFANSFFYNNLVEGFSGAGGAGVSIHSVTPQPMIVINNGVFNCTTAYNITDSDIVNDNETLGATPFAKSGSNTFANRFTYFAPVDTGNVWGKAASGTYPVGSGLDKGAIQHAGGGAAAPNFNIITQSA